MPATKKTYTASYPNPAKKLLPLVVSIILILILIPILIWILAYRKPHTAPSPISIPNINTLKSIKADGYTLSYPKDWSESESAGVKGGQVYYLQPPHADAKSKPHVILQVLDATPLTTKRMTVTYVLLKYQKETVTVSGSPAQKYTAILPSVHGPFHSIAYVFTKNGKIYLLELGYTQKATDTKLEQTFAQIVDGFSLT